MLFALSMRSFLPQRKSILEVLGDSSVETYGRDDLYEVFRAIKKFSQVKACKWSEVLSPHTANFGGTSRPPTSPGWAEGGRGRCMRVSCKL